MNINTAQLEHPSMHPDHGPHTQPPHHGPGRGPHRHRHHRYLQFDEADRALFEAIYGNEDDAAAAMQVILDAPPEIQILAVQLIQLLEKEAA